MSIDKFDFNAIQEGDLQELVIVGSPESNILEFKAAKYGNSDGEKSEMLKDISAFANTHGGHLILGINEVDGVAGTICSVCDENLDAEILRMEQIIRSGIESSITGIKIRAIPLSIGGHAIVLRIPKSWSSPHRVVAKGSNRFYLRNSAGTYQPSIEELRALFAQSSTALENARKFRDERIAEICNGTAARQLVGDGRLIIHIVPVSAFSGLVNLDLEAVDQVHGSFYPLGASGCNPRYNYHGFVNERGGDFNHGYTQVFRNGCVEATKGSIVRADEHNRFISGTALEESVFEQVPKYIDGLLKLGVLGPYFIFLTLEGVLNSYYAVNRYWPEDTVPLPENLMKLPEGFLESGNTVLDIHQGMRPTFDALWNALGYSSCQNFNSEGMWVAPSR
ncbi:MAG: ATP-binding protein [Arenicella sp.]|nr:ATP-binding protein [Arenicella sp.]